MSTQTRTLAERLFGHSTVLGALDAATRAALAAEARQRTWRAGQTIFTTGAPGDAMMAIAEGTVRIGLTAPSGREIVLAELHAGEVFGEIALLDGGERSADARALTNCTLIVLERRALLDLLNREPALSIRLIELLCARVRRSDARMMEIGFLDLPARLARVILRALGTVDDGRQASAKLSFSQTEFANMVGGSRETVNRCLRRWQQDEVVELRDGWLILRDRAALERLAEDPAT